MTISKIVVALGICGICASTQAQLRPNERFSITTEQVAAKLASTFAQKGVMIDANHITLPAGLTSTEASPTLEVRSVKLLRGNENTSSAVMLACANTRVCMPFYAVIAWPDAGNFFSASKIADFLRSASPERAATVIKSGSHVTLLMDRGSAHIQMSVITMENGGLSQTIKVRTPNRKQTFLAEVIDASTVKGTF